MHLLWNSVSSFASCFSGPFFYLPISDLTEYTCRKHKIQPMTNCCGWLQYWTSSYLMKFAEKVLMPSNIRWYLFSNGFSTGLLLLAKICWKQWIEGQWRNETCAINHSPNSTITLHCGSWVKIGWANSSALQWLYKCKKYPTMLLAIYFTGYLMCKARQPWCWTAASSCPNCGLQRANFGINNGSSDCPRGALAIWWTFNE